MTHVELAPAADLRACDRPRSPSPSRWSRCRPPRPARRLGGCQRGRLVGPGHLARQVDRDDRVAPSSTSRWHRSRRTPGVGARRRDDGVLDAAPQRPSAADVAALDVVAPADDDVERDDLDAVLLDEGLRQVRRRVGDDSHVDAWRRPSAGPVGQRGSFATSQPITELSFQPSPTVRSGWSSWTWPSRAYGMVVMPGGTTLTSLGAAR